MSPIRYAVRKGASKIIATGTPKVSRPARALIRRLLRGEEPGVIVRRLRTIDNAANLSEAFYKSVIGAAKGTRLERQELEGELLDDVENALWSRDLLERIQVPAIGSRAAPAPTCARPRSASTRPTATRTPTSRRTPSSGKGAPDDHHLYVAENWGGQEAPATFARRCILVAVRYEAELVVEKNHGGEWLPATFAQVMKDLAKEGKIPEGRCPRVRTGPRIAGQADQGRADLRDVRAGHRAALQDGLPRPPRQRGLAVDGGAGGPAGDLHGSGRGAVAGPAGLAVLEPAPVPERLVRPARPVGGAEVGCFRRARAAAQTEDSMMRRRLRSTHGGAYTGRGHRRTRRGIWTAFRQRRRPASRKRAQRERQGVEVRTSSCASATGHGTGP